jgi:putative salt-induced outer membrane protein YdiY
MRRTLSALFLLMIFGSPSLADQVSLKNGDRVTGQVVKKDGGALTFKSDVFGSITIPWDQVTQLSSDALLTVVHPDGRVLQGKVSTAEDRLLVATPTAQESLALAETTAIRNAAEQTAWERLQHPGWLQLWAGYLDFGTSLARGNAETTTITTGLNAARITRTDKTKVYFNQIYSTATIAGETSTAAQAVRGGWAYNRNVGPRLFINLFNDWEYDRFQDLDLRLVLGPGLGFNLLKTERMRVDLLGGGAYTHEEFSTPRSRNSGNLYWGNDWNYRLSDRTAFSQTFRMFNNLSETGEFRVNFDVGTVTAVNSWLSFQATYSDRYLSNPAGGRKKNDVLFTTGVRFTFDR